MNRHERGLFLLPALLLPLIAVGSSGAVPDAAPGHVLVKLRPAVLQELKAVTLEDRLAELLQGLSLPGGSLEEPVLNRLEREQQRSASGAAPVGPNLARFLYLGVPAGLSAEECARRVAQHPWVEYAETDGVATGGLIPTDPNFPSQWHHRNSAKPSACIQTPLAWDITSGSSNVVVAVLDTGVSPSAEFNGRLVEGYNFANPGGDTADDNGHGTAVAGTVAANANNATLVAGVDWHCRIMPVKVLDASNYGYYSWFAQGIDFAVNYGAKVINLSAGGASPSTAVTQAITNAIARGVIFATITHNDSSDQIRFPGNLTDCITVGATDEQDRRCGFSNYGPQIDLCAPGTNIYTVSRSGSLTYWWGTSFSAPQVAGVCALLASLRPGISQEDARLLLCAGAEDRVGDATDTPGFDNYYGWGRLNALNSLLLAQMRVDRTEWTNGTVRLSWPSPSNASNKQPCQVQFKSSPADSWQTATNTEAFTYTANRTYWSDTNVTSGLRYYRIRVRPLP